MLKQSDAPENFVTDLSGADTLLAYLGPGERGRRGPAPFSLKSEDVTHFVKGRPGREPAVTFHALRTAARTEKHARLLTRRPLRWLYGRRTSGHVFER